MSGHMSSSGPLPEARELEGSAQYLGCSWDCSLQDRDLWLLLGAVGATLTVFGSQHQVFRWPLASLRPWHNTIFRCLVIICSSFWIWKTHKTLNLSLSTILGGVSYFDSRVFNSEQMLLFTISAMWLRHSMHTLTTCILHPKYRTVSRVSQASFLGPV